VTAVSCTSSSFKRKEKEKENQYKIRKIKEKKNKIVSVQASHNNPRVITYINNKLVKLCFSLKKDILTIKILISSHFSIIVLYVSFLMFI